MNECWVHPCLSSTFSLYIEKIEMPHGKPAITVAELVSAGFLQPSKRGRRCLYETDEERLAVKRAQQRECMKRHNARIKEACEQMKASRVANQKDVISVERPYPNAA